jgi:predicted DNA binding CopG/RHH family protein
MKKSTEKLQTLDMKVQVRVSGIDLERVRNISKNEGINMSAVIRVVLKRWLTEHPEDKL